jgi:uncharacterized protein (TIGR02271 family)
MGNNPDTRPARRVVAVTKDGREGMIIHGVEGLGNEPSYVIIHFDNKTELFVPTTLLELQPSGNYRLEVTYDELRTLGRLVTPYGTGQVVIPVIEEEAEVTKQLVEHGVVRIHKRVNEHQHTINEPIFNEDVDVQRISVNRLVDRPIEPRYDGDTLVVPIYEEVLVVEKRLYVKEELRITKRKQTTTHTETVTLRSEEVIVDRTKPGTDPVSGA